MTYDDIEHRPLAAGWSISGPTALADVVVVADKDEPGRKHAAAVTANLDGHRAGHADDAVQSPATKKEESSRPIPDRAMFHGLLGDVVDALDPTTEADPVAVLVSLLAGVGVMIGDRPHLQVGNTRHPLLVWPLLFGRTSTGRKGEAWSTARRLLAAVDAVFTSTNIETGLSSGEGLVERIKDVPADDPDDDKGGRKPEWPGTADKRLLVIEPEFGAVMARAKRKGNTLASVLREAWDGRALAVLTKKRSRASTSHIAVISHVTPKEFRIRRAEADLAGGSYNRFLPVFVERSKSIPIGEGIAETDLRALAAKLGSAVQAAKVVTKISLDDQAKKLWTSDLYEELIGADHEDTAAAEFTRRAAPYCLRIAGLHAVLNRRDQVDADDLNAAAALVRYSVASARYVLEQTTGDPRLDRIRRAVADARTDGLSRTEISALFGRNAPVALLDELLAQLLTDPEFEEFTAASGGRPSTRYRRKFLLSSSQETTQGPDTPEVGNPSEHDDMWDTTEPLPPTCSTCGTALWPDGLCVTCEVVGGSDAA